MVKIWKSDNSETAKTKLYSAFREQNMTFDPSDFEYEIADGSLIVECSEGTAVLDIQESLPGMPGNLQIAIDNIQPEVDWFERIITVFKLIRDSKEVAEYIQQTYGKFTHSFCYDMYCYHDDDEHECWDDVIYNMNQKFTGYAHGSAAYDEEGYSEEFGIDRYERWNRMRCIKERMRDDAIEAARSNNLAELDDFKNLYKLAKYDGFEGTLEEFASVIQTNEKFIDAVSYFCTRMH